MDSTQKEALRKQLIADRNRIVDDLQARDEQRVENVHQPGELSSVPTHPADHDAERLGVDVRVEATLRSELQAIEQALERLRNDSDYGICQRCGQEIAIARLEVLPFTPYCIECERQMETQQTEDQFT